MYNFKALTLEKKSLRLKLPIFISWFLTFFVTLIVYVPQLITKNSIAVIAEHPLPLLGCLMILLLVYVGKLWTPQAYIISENSITIVRIIGKVVIFRKEIESVEIKSGIQIAGQLFGSGGADGYYGNFILDNGNKVTLYCTRIDKVVLIRTRTKVYGISPENPEKFCQMLKNVRLNTSNCIF